MYFAFEFDFLFILVLLASSLLHVVRTYAVRRIPLRQSCLPPMMVRSATVAFQTTCARAYCRFWIKMNESTILPVGCLLGAWACQSSGTKCPPEVMHHAAPLSSCHWSKRSAPPLAGSNLEFLQHPAFLLSYTSVTCILSVLGLVVAIAIRQIISQPPVNASHCCSINIGLALPWLLHRTGPVKALYGSYS